MGTPYSPKHIPYGHMEPLGRDSSQQKGAVSSKPKSGVRDEGSYVHVIRDQTDKMIEFRLHIYLQTEGGNIILFMQQFSTCN